MPYTPAIHHCRSIIRLKGYDYSQAGLYYVTLCCQDRVCRFGKTENGQMVFNEAGQMVKKWCEELSHKFPDIELEVYIIMPNHFHAIIVNNGANVAPAVPVTVGADLRVCPNNQGDLELGEHVGSPLHTVVQWFKTMTTNEYIRGVKTLGWKRFNKKLWQRNYWEHIIRNERAYRYIADYIIKNPEKWEKDKLYYKDKKSKNIL